MKGLRLYLIGSAILMVLYVLAQYSRPTVTDWTPTYLKEDKIPFGLYVLTHEFESLFPGAKVKTSSLPIYNTLKSDLSEPVNYLLIAPEIKADKLDYATMVSFMKRGNHVFIAAADLSKVLTDSLKIDTKFTFNVNTKSSVGVNFVNPELKTRQNYVFDKELGNSYFSKIDTAKATVLGRNTNGEINFVKYTFGKGALYILPSPHLLSNYNLLYPRGAEYASKVLSYLPANATLVLDEYNTRDETTDSSILRVLFKHDQLRWAYMLSITGLLIFVLFEMKRRQRIIPVADPLKNVSVEFAALIGKVYYEQRDNADLARKIISYFLEKLRADYRLQTQHIDEELAETLVTRSGVKAEIIQELFNLINQLTDKKKVNDHQLINLNKLIEEFYKQAR